MAASEMNWFLIETTEAANTLPTYNDLFRLQRIGRATYLHESWRRKEEKEENKRECRKCEREKRGRKKKG